ncbi:MAG TPA: hypothetical protein VGC94_01470 [Amnibacterium sp.]
MGRVRALVGAAGLGALCGLGGVAAMTLGEELERALTRRPASFVPARTLRTLTGRASGDGFRSRRWNHAMHWGTGAVLGALRGVWAVTGIRGPSANLHHAAVRLGFDQTLENATGAGAPPTSWPRSELLIDVLFKTVYSVATGLLADRLIPPRLQSRRGATSH